MQQTDIYVLHSDNGREYLGRETRDFLESIGCQTSTSPEYAAQMNGKAERLNRTLMALSRSMLSSSKLPRFLWSEALNFSCFIYNFSIYNKYEGKSPYELFFHRKPFISKIREFGTPCSYYNRKPNKSKLDDRGIKAFIVGIDESGLAYRLWDPNLGDIVRTKDVVMLKPGPLEESTDTAVEPESRDNEVAPGNPEKVTEEIGQATGEQIRSNESEQNSGEESNWREGEEPSTEQASELTSEQHDGQQHTHHHHHQLNERLSSLRPRSELRQPDRYVANTAQHVQNNVKNNINNEHVNEPDPITVKQAMESPNYKHWQEAMEHEMDSMAKHSVFSKVPRPKDGRIIKSGWVFKSKKGPNGEILKYRARFIVKGYSQVAGIDFDQTYSPVIRFDSIRVVLALAGQRRWHCFQLDIRTAYLHSELKYNLYTEQPEGFEDGTDKVIKLNRSTYGLRQAGRDFNETLNNALIKLKFKRSFYDRCLYTRSSPSSIYLLTYVDDVLVVGENLEHVQRFIKEFNEVFELSSEKLSFFLGMQIDVSPDRGMIHIHQERYISELQDRFGLTNCKTCSTPLPPGILSVDGSKIDKSIPFREIIGSLNFAAVATRGDISNAVSRLSRFLDKPTKELYAGAVQVLRYLAGTKRVGPVYTGEKEKRVVVFVDADWASSSDRKSTSGSLTQFGRGPTCWTASRQSNVSLSSAEAELNAISDAARNLVWLKGLLEELNVSCVPEILSDSLSAIRLAEEPVFRNSSKHINVRSFFIREKLDAKEMTLKYVKGEDNLSDAQTKGLSKSRFQKLRELSGFKNVPTATPDSGAVAPLEGGSLF